MFTTEPSINAMLDPRMVAASVRRLRFSDRAAGKAGVARMIPASQGGRVKPTMSASRSVPTTVRLCETPARQAASARRQLGLPHYARPAECAFQRFAVPLRRIGRGLIGALQEFEQRLIRLRGRAHGVVGQDELAERLAEERRIGP